MANFSKSKFRDRMSMYEGSTYLAEPNNPTNYLEIFNLENPKFDHEAIRNSQDTKKKEITKVTTSNSTLKILESQQIKPFNSKEHTKVTNLNQPKRAKSPSPLISEKNPGLTAQINVNPLFKPYGERLTLETQRDTPLDIKLRTKKPLNNLNEPNKLNKFSNRFSMFEPTCQKSCNTLKFNRLTADTNREHSVYLCGDQEFPKSIKDRIKLFSK